MTSLTFGTNIPQRLAFDESGNFDADRYAELVVQAENIGYDHVMLADHVFVPDYWADLIGDLFFEPFTLFSYLAARTSRIRLVFACLVVPYRQPFTTAKTVAAVDQLSHGRFELGVVPGYQKEEFSAFNIPRSQRGAMTEEFVRIMQALWTGHNVSFAGKYYSFRDVTIKPACLQLPHVPIWVGGSSSSAMRRVAEFGDVWHPLGFQPVSEEHFAAHRDQFTNSMQTGGTTPDLLREGLATIGAMAADRGRDISDLKVVVNAGSRIDGQPVTLGGDRIVERLGQYTAAGATGFSISAPGATAGEYLDNLARFKDQVASQL